MVALSKHNIKNIAPDKAEHFGEFIGSGINRDVYRYGESRVIKIPKVGRKGNIDPKRDLRLNDIFREMFGGKYAHYATYEVQRIYGREVLIGPFLPGRVLSDADRIPCSTISELERLGYIMSDNKGSNFMRMPEGEVVPIDAKFIGCNLSDSIRSTTARRLGYSHDWFMGDNYIPTH